MSKPRRDLLFAGSGTVASRIAWFVAIPIVARLYSPTDVGAWPLVTAVAAIVAVFGTLRLDVAITIAHYTRRAQTLVFATIALTIILSVLIAVSIALAPSLAARLMGASEAGAILYACPLFILLTNVVVILQAWLLRTKSIMTVTFANACTPIVTVCALIAFAFAFGPSAGSFVAAYLIGMVAPALIMCRAAVQTGLLDGPMALSLRSIRSSIGFFRAYPLYTVPQSLVGVGSERLVQLWLASAYSVETLGVFFLARQVLASPINAVTVPLQQVVFANLARMATPVERRTFALPVLKISMAAAGIVIGLGTVVIPIFVPLLLGLKYAAAADYAQWLVLGVALLMVSVWIDRLYDVARRVRLSMVMNIAYFGLVVMSVITAYFFQLNITAFVALYALALLFGNAMFILAALIVSRFESREIVAGFVHLFIGIAGSAGIAVIANTTIGGLTGAVAATVAVMPISLVLIVSLLRKM